MTAASTRSTATDDDAAHLRSNVRQDGSGRSPEGEHAAPRPVTLRPLGCNQFEVHRGGRVEGSAYFARYRTSTGIEAEAWIERPGCDILHLHTVTYQDFARAVRQVFG